MRLRFLTKTRYINPLLLLLLLLYSDACRTCHEWISRSLFKPTTRDSWSLSSIRFATVLLLVARRVAVKFYIGCDVLGGMRLEQNTRPSRPTAAVKSYATWAGTTPWLHVTGRRTMESTLRRGRDAPVHIKKRSFITALLFMTFTRSLGLFR